jgi:eukaryotic-like serine/threonine-protein kinase
MPVDERLQGAVEGRYRIEQEIGHGGMATVYLAQDLRLGTPVAIKLLRREVTGLIGSGRFRREIEILRRLNHPAIVPVLDAFESPSLHYYVMPHVAGQSLRGLLASAGPLATAEALRITGVVAGALDYAHASGILHRDIKPANILLQGDRVLVCDFGLARAVELAAADTASSSGLVLGTPAYMSPEQATGGEVNERTDVYALACVVYEMLAGEPAFSGPNAQAIVARVVAEAPRPLATVRPGLPPALEAGLRRALDKSPRRRPASAGALFRALTAGS